MGTAMLTIVPIKDMRYAGQLLDYARVECQHRIKARYSALPMSVHLRADDWLSYLSQLKQAFSQQYGIEHSMDSLPDMHDWTDLLAKQKQRHLLILRLPKVTSVELLVKLIQWSVVKQKRSSTLQVIVAVNEEMMGRTDVQQAIQAVDENINIYQHDGQHHQYEPQFQRTTHQPIVSMALAITFAAVSGLWFFVQPTSKGNTPAMTEIAQNTTQQQVSSIKT